MENRATSTTAFVIDQPFDIALPQIRHAISASRLLIAVEIDAARRVKRTLDIHVPPCRVLLLDNPTVALESTFIDRACGVFIPLHLVVSGAGDRTLLHLLNPEHIRKSQLPIGIRAPVQDLHREITQSLAAIARRAPDLEEVADRGESISSGETPALRTRLWFRGGR